MRSTLLILFTGLLLLSSCATSLELEEAWEAPAPPPPPAPYHIQAGDRLLVEYCRAFPPMDSYVLGVGDELQIQVHQHDELALTTSVAPDGTIAFHRVGTVPAAGRTVDQLRDALEEALAAYFPAPEVSVFLLASDVRTERFVEMLLRHPNGATREVRVAADGRVSLPGVGPVEVGGASLLEAEARINDALQERLPSLQVVLNSLSSVQNIYSIMGEIESPGVYPMPGETTLVEALAQAGGETEYADLERVVVMSRGSDGAVEARLYDVADALAHGNPLPDVVLRPRDTILVLSTGIGNVNDAIELFIRRNLPVQVGTGVVYRLNE